jgi:O-methyltransferase
MYKHVSTEIIRDAPIDFLEFGVYRGESIREWASLNTHAQSRFYGFDSFEGLPEKWRPSQEKGHFDVNGNTPQIHDNRVALVKGWFDQTVPEFVRGFVPRNRTVLHLDADLYSSTMLPLISFNHLLKQGTLLLFDEFYDRDHEFKAFEDYRKVSKRNYRVRCEANHFAQICVELL